MVVGRVYILSLHSFYIKSVLSNNNKKNFFSLFCDYIFIMDVKMSQSRFFIRSPHCPRTLTLILVPRNQNGAVRFTTKFSSLYFDVPMNEQKYQYFNPKTRFQPLFFTIFNCDWNVLICSTLISINILIYYKIYTT